MIGEMSPRGERLPGVSIERGQRLAEEEHAKTGNRSDERQQQGRLGGGPAVFTLGKALHERRGAARVRSDCRGIRTLLHQFDAELP